MATASEPAPSLRIANGEKAGVCALPAVANLDYGMCTGTLIHPQVVLYAAHCGRVRRLTLGENGKGPVVVKLKRSMVQPDFSTASVLGPKGSRIDWAFGILEEPVPGLPVIPLAYAGELDQIMKPGQAVFQTGYGEDGTGSKFTDLHWIDGHIESIDQGMIVTKASEQNACPGDSGGPLLVQLRDDTWRVAGIASTLGPDIDACGKSHGYNRYAQVRPKMLEWLEKETGVDLTPCYTLSGEIDRSDACKDFFAGDIAKPSGSWDNNCSEAKVVESPDLVAQGEADDEATDDTAPTLSIQGLRDNDKVQEGERIELEVEVKDDSPITKVTLVINDKTVTTWQKPPYTYTWEPKDPGRYIIEATAQDQAENVGNSDAIKVRVLENKDPSKSPDDSDDNESDDESDESDEDGGGLPDGFDCTVSPTQNPLAGLAMIFALSFGLRRRADESVAARPGA